MSFYCMENIRTTVTTVSYTSGYFAAVARTVGGLREDMYSNTTHAIKPSVSSTSLNKEYFDGITYNKGFTVLRQLNYLIGDTNFFNGVKNYLTNFGFKNATIDDFFTEMTPYFRPTPAIADYTMADWRRDWIETPSLNVLSVSWDSSVTVGNADLTITQRAYSDKYPTLRYHKITITWVKENNTVDNTVALVNNT
jgi:aminopeptidase N